MIHKIEVKKYTLECSCGEKWTGVTMWEELLFWELGHPQGPDHRTAVKRESALVDGRRCNECGTPTELTDLGERFCPECIRAF